MAGLRIRDLGSAFASAGGAFACLADLSLAGNQLSGAQGLAGLPSLTALNLNLNRCVVGGGWCVVCVCGGGGEGLPQQGVEQCADSHSVFCDLALPGKTCL
jgi:hypothetical protein